MGREVKRVPLDFDHPQYVVWPGYLKFCGDQDCDLDCDECQSGEPPTGEGWQMWETTSEGSPISPVLESPEKLAAWLADNEASAFGLMTATYHQWLSMIRRGWAPSAVVQNGRLDSGVAGL